MASRVSGVVREIAINAWIGTGIAGEAFTAALQIPKVLQNLLGEGSLSASFVPVYSESLSVDDSTAGSTPQADAAARSLAGGVLGLLGLVVALLVVLLVLAARPIAWVLTRGFGEEKRELTIDLMRLMAPGIGAIVLAAWCLGVLNAHRRFLLSYLAPVLWNVAIIAAIAVAAARDLAVDRIAVWAAWGVLIGGVAQFVVQLPSVVRVAGAVVPNLRRTDAVRSVLRRFVPAVAGRGVVTIATWIDLLLATFLVTGALRFIATAQVFYLLPISVFAMSVAAAELPLLSQEQGRLDSARQRIFAGAERIVTLVTFPAVAFIVGGLAVIAVIFERGDFTRSDSIAVWLTLAAYSLGIVASGISRLLQNASFAAGDVSGPARIVAVRVAVSIVIGLVLMVQFDRIEVVGSSLERIGDLPAFGPVDEATRARDDITRLGAVGLALGASVAAWLELALLRRRLRPTYGELGVGFALRQIAMPAAIAALVGGVLAMTLNSLPPIIWGAIALGIASMAYLFVAARTGSITAKALLSRLPGL